MCKRFSFVLSVRMGPFVELYHACQCYSRVDSVGDHFFDDVDVDGK